MSQIYLDEGFVESMQKAKAKQLILCAGLQSGGTTLVSWCFLQRGDMDGILDMPHDVLKPPPRVTTPYVWVKSTIACFRWDEAAEYYRSLGYEVKPLLVVRDPRRAYESLRRKYYGVNGTTAEDPPLRIRMLRFLRDWEQFSSGSWPIVRYESLLEKPEIVLREACADLALPWDEGMVTWPKPWVDIADTAGGNDLFLKSLGSRNLKDALIRPDHDGMGVGLPVAELKWLESLFARFNSSNGYPAHMESEVGEDPISAPDFAHTRRKQWQELWRDAASLQRLKGHRVIGRVIRLWGRLVNKDIRGL